MVCRERTACCECAQVERCENCVPVIDQPSCGPVRHCVVQDATARTIEDNNFMRSIYIESMIQWESLRCVKCGVSATVVGCDRGMGKSRDELLEIADTLDASNR